MDSEEIFKRVFEAMQPAEELGGPEEWEYIALMHRIAREAVERAGNCVEIMLQDQERRANGTNQQL